MKVSVLRRYAPSHAIVAIAFASVFLPGTLPAIDSNGTGGGSFESTTTWAGGVVPTGTFQVLADDTVRANGTMTYNQPATHNIVRGTFSVSGGAFVTMGRLNDNLVVSGSSVLVANGSLSMGRIAAAAGSSNNTLRVVSGIVTLRDAVVTGSHTSIRVDADGHFFAGGGINGPLTLNGGRIYFSNSAKKTGGSFTWNKGTIVLSSGAAYNSGEANTIFNAWRTNDANVLALSNETVKRTVILGLGSSNPTLSASQGTLSFNVYSAANHDNDRLALAGTSSLSLTSGVDIRIEAMLPGTPADYLGRTYKLFDIASGNYANLKPTVATTRWMIGATGYQVGWTNTLGTNGTLTVASLTPTGPVDAITVSDFNLPAQDAQGWTILTPAGDSRLIYVDPVNGNDSTGTYYLPGAAAVGPDPRSPVGPIQAVRSLSAAAALLRENQPDWLLLKSGGVWTGQSLDVKRGRSSTERAVVCAYGTGPRPELRTGSASGISDFHVVNLIIQGIRFWAHTRDKDGPYFTSYAGSSGFSFATRVTTDARQVRDVLIEDCVFRSYANNTATGNRGSDGDGAPVTRLVIRRSIISGNYKDSDGHSQGLYHSGSGQPLQPTILLQENTFYHNGWRIQSKNGSSAADGQATIFNHNTYFTDAKGVIFEKNLFLQPSSINNKWTATYLRASDGIVLRNNLYVDGEIGVSMGGNGPYTSGLRFANVSIRENVFTDIGRSRPTNRYLSWGVDVIDWNRGFVTDNLIIHQRHTGITNTYGLQVTAETLARDVFVGGNVFANLRAGTSTTAGIVHFKAGDKLQNVRFEDNIVQTPTATPLVRLVTGGISFSGVNHYHSAASASRLFSINNAYASLATWKTTTGDANAITSAPSFPAPTRDVEGYIASLGRGSTFQDFVNAVHGQSKANWNPALTAPAVNTWLRAGFGMSATPLEGWRQFHFEATGNAGDAADDADPDGDGLANLIEYATGTNPAASNPSAVVLGTTSGGEFLTLSFNRAADPSITYTVLAGNDPRAFVPVATYPGGATGVLTYVDTVSLSTPGVRRFLRLRVSN